MEDCREHWRREEKRSAGGGEGEGVPGEGEGRPGPPPPPTRTEGNGEGNGERKEPHARRPGTEARDTQQETTEARRARGRAATILTSAQRSLVLTKCRHCHGAARCAPGQSFQRAQPSPTRRGGGAAKCPDCAPQGFEQRTPHFLQLVSARWRGCKVPRLRAAAFRSVCVEQLLSHFLQPNSARWRGCVVPRLRAAVGRVGEERGCSGRGGRGSLPVLLGRFSVILSRNRTKCVSLRDVFSRTFPPTHEPNRQGWGLRTPAPNSPRGTRLVP